MKNTIKILLHFKVFTFFYLLLIFLMEAIWIINMFFTNKLFESLIFSKNDFLKYFIIFVALIGLKLLIIIIKFIFNKSFKLKVSNFIRQKSLKQALRFGEKNEKTTDITISKVLTNVDFVTEEGVWSFFEIISNFLVLLFSISLLTYYHWSYGLLAGFFAIILSLLPILYKNKYAKYQKQIITIDNNYNGEIGTLINQRNSLYLLSKLNVVNNIAAKLTLKKNRNSYKIYKKMMIMFSPNMVFGIIVQIAAPILSVILAHYGLVSVTLVGISSFILMTAFYTLIIMPELIRNFSSSRIIMNDLFKKNNRATHDSIKEIEINKINPIINKKELFSKPISFNININSKLNIIGNNGTGKSSLLNIFKGKLLSFNGAFKVNGIENLALLGQKGVIFLDEKPFIFSGSIRENISLFNKYISDIDITKSLNDVNLKFDLDDIVSNETLSDGQKQKISIARAFVYNPNILFLDESLNNIDIKSKNQIEKQFLSRKMAIIIISHKELSNEFTKIKIN